MSLKWLDSQPAILCNTTQQEKEVVIKGARTVTYINQYGVIEKNVMRRDVWQTAVLFKAGLYHLLKTWEEHQEVTPLEFKQTSHCFCIV